jgi:hypothetical protein
MIEITPDGPPEEQGGGHAVLLLPKHRYTGTVTCFLCRTPNPVPLAKLIRTRDNGKRARPQRGRARFRDRMR